VLLCCICVFTLSLRWRGLATREVTGVSFLLGFYYYFFAWILLFSFRTCVAIAVALFRSVCSDTESRGRGGASFGLARVRGGGGCAVDRSPPPSGLEAAQIQGVLFI
jgi:hypothetical protein